MSRTAQKNRQKQDTPTEVQSMTLMRNLLRTTISSITYLRQIFPEDCFRDKQLCGINIKGLAPENEEAKILCKWLEDGLFDALSKKYLRVMIFGIYEDPDRESTLIECYFFRFAYGDGQENISLNVEKKSSGKTAKVETAKLTTKDDIKKATVNCLRSLITVSQTLKPLPDTRYLTMKLLYYDKITPPEYQPPFFDPATYDEPFSFDSSPVKVKIGEVITPYHSLNLKLKTTVDLFEEEKLNEDALNKGLGKFMIEDTSDANHSDNEAEEEEHIKPIATNAADDETQDMSNEELQLLEAVKECLTKFRKPTIEFLTAHIPDLSEETAKALLEKLHQDEFLGRSKGCYTILPAKADAKAESKELYKKCLELVLAEDYVSCGKISKGLGVNQTLARDLMKRLEKDGFVGKLTKDRHKGHRVLDTDRVKQVLEKIHDAGKNSDKTTPALAKTEKKVEKVPEPRKSPAKKDTESLKRKLAEAFELSSSQETNPAENPKCSKTTKPIENRNSGPQPKPKKQKTAH